MKKLITFILISVVVSGCGPSYNEQKIVNAKIRYFQDPQTNICFAEIESHTAYDYNVISIACVPCDSLKNLK